jgi:hypothetical protein
MSRTCPGHVQDMSRTCPDYNQMSGTCPWPTCAVSFDIDTIICLLWRLTQPSISFLCMEPCRRKLEIVSLKGLVLDSSCSMFYMIFPTFMY